MLLSDYYGKMVRQGQSFKVTGVQASLRPDPSASGIDVGLSAEVMLKYMPTTRHSKFAWNQVYKNWRNQKKLATAVGAQVRYDDLEFGFNMAEGGSRDRTSTIFGTGMGDSSTEKLVLTGASSGGSDFSLEDYYNSAYSTPAASEDPFTGTAIKEPKWGSDPFPKVQQIHCTATSSANTDADELAPHFGGAITMGDIQSFPVGGEANVLCGVLNAAAYIMPDDTISQDEDDFILTITLFVQSWKSLLFSPKRKYKRWKTRSGGRKYAGRRWYRKSRRRGR